MPVKLTDYQEEAYQKFLLNDYVIVDAQRGMGKTTFIKEVVRRHAGERMCVCGLGYLRKHFVGLPKVRFITNPTEAKGENFVLVDQYDFIPPSGTRFVVAHTFFSIKHPSEAYFTYWRNKNPFLNKPTNGKEEHYSSDIASQLNKILGK